MFSPEQGRNSGQIKIGAAICFAISLSGVFRGWVGDFSGATARLVDWLPCCSAWQTKSAQKGSKQDSFPSRIGDPIITLQGVSVVGVLLISGICYSSAQITVIRKWERSTSNDLEMW